MYDYFLTFGIVSEGYIYISKVCGTVSLGKNGSDSHFAATDLYLNRINSFSPRSQDKSSSYTWPMTLRITKFYITILSIIASSITINNMCHSA